jgi:hypothetical protein
MPGEPGRKSAAAVAFDITLQPDVVAAERRERQ